MATNLNKLSWTAKITKTDIKNKLKLNKNKKAITKMTKNTNK